MKKYLELMFNFDFTELKQILGNDIVENLNEWDISSEEKWSRKKIIEMIDCLYGVNLLRDKKIIERILRAMPVKDLKDLCRRFYPSLLEKIPDSICSEISVNWGNNDSSLAVLSELGVNENIFEVQKKNEVAVTTVVDSPERFYELLDYQFYIKQQALHILNSENQLARFLIHMPTGTGKTKTSMHIITNYLNFTLKKQGLVIWVAHTTELLQQAFDTFVATWHHLGDGEINAYRIWADNSIEDSDIQLNGIMFCGIQKLIALSKSDEKLFNRLVLDCRLFVFDEAHKAAAIETRKIVEAFMTKKQGMGNRFLMGLTATPGRTTDYSDDNKKFSNMFDDNIISIDTNLIAKMNMGRIEALNTSVDENVIKYFQKRKILSKMIKKTLEYQSQFSVEELKILNQSVSAEKDYSAKQLEILARSKERNKKIMMELRVLQSEQKPTIVFACSVLHAKMISAMLTLEEIPNALVISEMSSFDRKRAIDSFKDRKNPCNIIINYDVLTTGFDSTNIQCVFITRPTKSIVLYSQMLGRGLRGPMMGGQEECLLLDVKDNLESFDNEKAFSYFDSYWNK
ncbi:MAG: DEAD/DEAH box helicase family protein [Treponema sp.]|nr:DEAD/DEAH box helicase family protein [Treponema sp.]